MMRKPHHLVVALATSALLAAGGVTAGLVVSANANVQTTCDGSNPGSTGEEAGCEIESQEVFMPSSITLVVTLKSGDGQNNQVIQVAVNGGCVSNYEGADYTPISWPINPSPRTPISTAAAVSINVPLPYPDPYYCSFDDMTASLQASLGGGTYDGNTTGSFELELEYTPQTSATATPSPSASSPAGVPLIKGYGGKCLDDKGNSSADRTEVIIWTCDSADSAEGWKFTGGELVHDGKCANDRANGGGGTKVILWTCNRAPDEMWTHTGGDGEFVLGSRSHGLLCLDDPRSSTANRTQLIVYSCRNTSNQHWT
jgi:hypothetical protein